MGCDIHTQIQVRRKDTQQWENFNEGIFFNSYDYHVINSAKPGAPEPIWYKMMDTKPFNWRSYGMFEFLTGGVVRPMSLVPSPYTGIRGWPDDQPTKEFQKVSDVGYDGKEFFTLRYEGDYDYHSFHYVFISELLNFDYDQKFNDVREGGMETTVREFLGTYYFRDLYILASLRGWDFDEVRVLMCFDN